MPSVDKPEPVSRRNRPAKAPLSRRAIVDAALEIAESSGTDGVTMRRVAERLDTAAGSLYVYVANRDELMASMLDTVFGRIDYVTDSTLSWQDQLVTLVSRQVAGLAAFPGLAASLAGAIPVGENVAMAGEKMLALLIRGGVEPQRAAWGLDLLALYAMTSAMEQTARVDNEAHDLIGRERLEDARERYSTLDPQRYPIMSSMVNLLLSGEGLQRQEWAIRVLLAGIVSTETPLG